VLNIKEALAGQSSGQASGKCKIGRWLDEEVADHPDRDKLVAAIELRRPRHGSLPEGYLPVENALQVLRRLEFDVSDKTLKEHRGRVCRCFP
jgi:hypothetical protein